jgi:hypothetical protein
MIPGSICYGSHFPPLHRRNAEKFRPMLGAKGLRGGRGLFRSTPAVTRCLGFFLSYSKKCPISRLLRHKRGCGGSIPTRSHIGPHSVAPYDTQCWRLILTLIHTRELGDRKCYRCGLYRYGQSITSQYHTYICMVNLKDTTNWNNSTDTTDLEQEK